ncbi:serine hydrolase domain-containing protein [Photobacterium sp. DNB22_13_2]
MMFGKSYWYRVSSMIGCVLVCSLLALSHYAFAERKIDKEKMDRYLTTLAENNKATLGVVVVDKGKVTYSHQTSTPSQLKTEQSDIVKKYKAGSITKTFTSTLIFQLIEQGEIELSTPLSTFYPEFEYADDITIGHMLSHRSGLYNYTNAKNFIAYFNTYQTKEQMLQRVASYPVVFTPNKKHEYSNTNYLLLGYIIEDVTGKSYGEVVKENIIDRVGLKNTEYCASETSCGQELESFFFSGNQWFKSPSWSMSVASAAGAIISTPYDLTKFIRALFNGELVSEDSLKQMKGTSNLSSKGLFRLPLYSKYSYGHRGLIESFNSDLSYFESDDLAVAINVDALNYNFNDITIGILSIYYGIPFTLPNFERQPITVVVDNLKGYEGSYTSPDFDLDINLSVINGILMLQATGQEAIPLEAYSEHEFEFKPAGILCKFGMTASGDIDYSKFALHQGNLTFAYQRQ